MIGRTIDYYQIIGTLGSGGMGEVFVSKDLQLERYVAIKRLKPELVNRPDVVARFRSEAVTLAQINHPNVAMVYAFLQESNDFCLVMEYVKGWTLQRAIELNGALDPPIAINLLQQVLDGVGFAHQHQIIHRDLKPGNMMLTDTGVIKVMDFGLARALGADHLTRTGHLVGTLEYISPEQIRGEETDIRSDIYSLGVVLYELITGRLPFVTTSEYELMKAQVEDQPPSPREFMPGVASDLEQVVLKALKKEPELRFQSTEEFAEELTRCIPARHSQASLYPLLETLKTRAPLEDLSENVSRQTRFVSTPREPDAAVKPTRLTGTQTDDHSQPGAVIRNSSLRMLLVPSLIVAASVAAVGLLFYVGAPNSPPDSPTPNEQTDMSEHRPAPESQRPVIVSPTLPTASPQAPVSVPPPSEQDDKFIPAAPTPRSEVHWTDEVTSNGELGAGHHDKPQKHLDDAKPLDSTTDMSPKFTQPPAVLQVESAGSALEAGFHDKAQQHLEGAKQLNPNIIADPNFAYVSAQVQVRFGEKARKNERYQDAKRHFEDARDLILSIHYDPKNLEHHFLLGQIYHYLYQHNDAKKILYEILESNPDHSKALYYLGMTYYISQQWDETEETLTKALNLSNHNIENILYYLAISQNRLNKKEACKKNIIKVLQINPNHERAISYDCN